MSTLRDFFSLNQTIILFVSGQVFFVLGLAIIWQSRKHSRLDLARSLGWLGIFGLAHGIHEWGDIFIPIQAEYLSLPWIDVLSIAQVVLLALSFASLFQFGAATLAALHDEMRWLQAVPGVLLVAWMGVLLWVSEVSRWDPGQLVDVANVWARYLLGIPGALISAVGLWQQARQLARVPEYGSIAQTFELASLCLVAYAALGGLLGPYADFFPARVLNAGMTLNLLGVPVQLLRSLVGLVLVAAIVRGLDVFEVEVDRRFEEMESAQLLAAERQRISRELHDGAIQTVYSAGLIAESIRHRIADESPLAARMDRVVLALNHAVRDLRQFIAELEPGARSVSLIEGLRDLATDPHLQTLTQVSVTVHCGEDDSFSPARATHVVAIINEALSNTARHSQARHAWVEAERHDGHLQVTVADDGIGLAAQGVEAGFGLRNMRDRARLLGGTLAIEHRVPQGTQVILRVPWDETP